MKDELRILVMVLLGFAIFEGLSWLLWGLHIWSLEGG